MHFQAAPDRWRPPRNPFRIGLGEMFRALKIDTEVGSSDPAASAKIQGICASARAYAFLGGVERSLDENAKLGFHRFYIKIPWRNLVLNCSPGQDLVDEAQRTTLRHEDRRRCSVGHARDRSRSRCYARVHHQRSGRKALGIEVPAALLAQAEEVIE